MQDKRCLLVDDDLDDREIFIDVLQDIDKEIICHTATNGLEALSFLEKASPLPDFIFLDLNMPVMSGIQFLTEIKRHNKFDAIKIIIYTTSSYEKDIKETQELGANHFLTKPYSTVSLADSILRLLSNKITTYVVKTAV